jgi:uncharacterized membrane protein
MPFGCIALFVLFALLFLLPFFLANAVLAALVKLGLSPGVSLLAAFGIFLGGMVNLPVKRLPHDETVRVLPRGLFGLERTFPQWVRPQGYTILAVNVGGCIVPAVIALYELTRLANQGLSALAAAVAAIGINTFVCFRAARPVENVGIALPVFVSPLVAAVCALVFLPGFAPPVAFAAGVLGPLLGADLFHLSDVTKTSTGMASIGGAGTFDGIVLSGLLATLLA